MTVTTFTSATGGDDGGGNYTGDATWPPDGGAFLAENNGAEYVVKQKNGAVYDQYWMCLRWDTSSIPDADTIQSATLNLYLFEISDIDGTFSFVADYYDYGGNPMVAGDWIETPSPSIFTAIDLTAGITSDAVNVISLTDLSGISKTGFTGIRLGVSAGTPTGLSDGVRVAAYDHATLQEPRLVVTHSSGQDGDNPPIGIIGRGAGW